MWNLGWGCDDIRRGVIRMEYILDRVGRVVYARNVRNLRTSEEANEVQNVTINGNAVINGDLEVRGNLIVRGRIIRGLAEENAEKTPDLEL